MKIDAQSIEELIEKSGTRAESLRRLDTLIVETAPDLQRRLFTGPSITMIGEGELVWENMSSSGAWPLFAVAPQKITSAFMSPPNRKALPSSRSTAIAWARR